MPFNRATEVLENYTSESLIDSHLEPQSLARKRRFVDAYGLDGSMFWSELGELCVKSIRLTLRTQRDRAADSQLTVEELHKIPCGDNQDRETENRFDDPGRHEFLKPTAHIDSSKSSHAE